MGVPILHHTRMCPPREAPSATIPVTMVARDLQTDEFLLPHSHPWGQVTMALEGVLRITANNSSWVLPPMRAIWIAPNVEHAVTILEKTRLRPLCIHAARAPFAGRDCKVLEVSNLLRQLIMALEQLDPGQEPAREALLAELILDELKRSDTRPIRVPLPNDKRLKTLCDSLIDKPGSNQTLEHWAQLVGASERTLARLFERELGMSFGQWRQQVRLAHAAPMIARGVPLSQVAEELGYASQSAFSAMFKKTFGSSPSAFFAQGDRM
ncbi:helix-turn-helix domain-containing protein [Janthinobacterium sp. GW458P]|uniref:AraC family transcriptional regulator n=1 Tax=Janthinobacterium sp. GW458P TaxID=1981504 RepID=UPI001555E509|nr:helix-turn-helix transcriptional regulator [Janthinobacterium sp. GW458P]MBE3025398.1 helix-turn-helix transcriptional regulator [Janthinobacterium sp. GW458P]